MSFTNPAGEPANESARFATLNQHSTWYSLPEEAFDDLTSLASLICGAPFALVSLADSGRTWLKSNVRLTASQTSKLVGFCSRIVLSDRLLIIPDAAADERLASHPLVTFAPNLRFYAGMPLIAAHSQRIGTLCVIDTCPRNLDEVQAAALERIARTVTTQLELRRSVRQTSSVVRSLRNIQWYTQTQVTERTRQLAAANHSLQLLTGQLMQAQEVERRRIARELHYETGQVLTALNMTIDGMAKQSPGNSNGFAECKKLVDLAISEIRNLSYLLHPPLMDEVGLSSAVGEYVRGFEKRSGISVQVKVSQEIGRLEPDQEIALFRVVQESFVNIHRHSGSRTASVALDVVDNAVVLEIRDHGKGFPTGLEDSHFGLGIRSMQERLRNFGGSLQVESCEAGTTIRAELPRAPAPGLFVQQSA